MKRLNTDFLFNNFSTSSTMKKSVNMKVGMNAEAVGGSTETTTEEQPKIDWQDDCMMLTPGPSSFNCVLQYRILVSLWVFLSWVFSFDDLSSFMKTTKQDKERRTHVVVGPVIVKSLWSNLSSNCFINTLRQDYSQTSTSTNLVRSLVLFYSNSFSRLSHHCTLSFNSQVFLLKTEKTSLARGHQWKKTTMNAQR